MGQVLTAGQGQNPARQAAIAAGLPNEATAYTVNQVCGSGLRTVALKDGLWEAFNGYHMGRTAENVAVRWKISREQQDELALRSQALAEQAQKTGRFKDEIVPVKVTTRKGDVLVDTDEYPKDGTTMETLAKLRPAFDKNGTVTAGNASGINDGAAATVLMSDDEARRRGVRPLARIVSVGDGRHRSRRDGHRTDSGNQARLQRARWKVGDLDLIEANEAFAAQACAVIKEVELDRDKVNENGGAIALGHPIGASGGTRVLVTLLHELQRRGARRGLATLCIGGGIGIAMCVERT